MAYKINEQINEHGKLVRRKVNRAWMMGVIQTQQSHLNKLSTLIVTAKQIITEQRETINELTSRINTLTPVMAPGEAEESLGLPPLPVKQTHL